MVLASIFDLTSACRKTNGAIPPKLVGASTTVIGTHMYLFGGRQVAERKMASDLYRFDLETLVWTKLPNHPDDDLPCPRYFHSSDSWGNLLIIFGGMSNQPDSPNPDELCVLNDVRLYDIEAGRWLPSTPDIGGEAPRARYAHLSSVTADRLFIIGGQDFFNTWLDDVCVYDLLARTWVQRRDYPRHCGTYRSVAVSSNMTVRYPTPQNHPRFSSSASGDSENTAPESLVFHPYSAPPTEDHPADIYLYSNYNFTDVKRELEVFSPLPDTDFTITDRSGSMAGTTFPPGLRFPTGAILGNHLIIAGTYLAHSYQSFSIWVLDLQTMHWSRIDPGKAVETGSWFRGCLAPFSNRFYIFGNRDGNLVDDYNRRLLSWEHVAVVDLEAFGIYQPPPARVDISMQELGLTALEEGILADFEVVCEDGRKVPCSRKLLEERWPWFHDQRRKLLESALHAMESMPTSPMHVDLPSTYKGADPRLTPRALHLSEPYPITLALIQYFYAQALITPLQQAPAVLSQLLVLATTYNIEHLEELVKHAMHRALSNSTSVGVYEVATLCNCRSLQIRALKTVMSYTQKRSGNSKGKDGRGPPPPPSNSDHNTNGGSESYSRPRGTSDAKWRTMGGGGDSSGTYSSSDRHGRQVARSPKFSHVSSSEDDEPAPLPLFTPRKKHNRGGSTVSIGTDLELREMSELLMSTVQPEMERVTISNRYSSSSSDMHSHPLPLESDEFDFENSRVFIPADRQSSYTVDSATTTPSMTSASSLSSRSSSARGPVTPLTMSPLPHIVERELPHPPPSPGLPLQGLPSPLSPSFSQSSFSHQTRPSREAYTPSVVTSNSDHEHDHARAWPKEKSTIEWVTSRTSSLSSPEGTILPIPDSPTTRKGIKSLFGSKTKDSQESRDLKEMKKRKAEEKRLRTERLAEDLKARAMARKQAAQETASLSSSERAKLKGPVSMYGGADANLVM